MKRLLTTARVSEVGDAANRISAAFGKYPAARADNFLAGLLAEISSSAATLTQAVKRDRAVSELEDADARRDAELRVLGRLLKGYKAIPVAALRPHGERLSAIFDKYGARIADAGYAEESNLVDALLMDFSAPDLAPAISALAGTSEAIANLASAQRDFAGLRTSYDAAVAGQKEGQSASILRKPLLQLLNLKLIPYVEAVSMANPDNFGGFAGEVSQIIDTINLAIKSRAQKPEPGAAKG